MRRILGIAVVLAVVVSGAFMQNDVVQGAGGRPSSATVTVGTADIFSFTAPAPTTAERWLECGVQYLDYDDDPQQPRALDAEGRCPYQSVNDSGRGLSHTICTGPFTYSYLLHGRAVNNRRIRVDMSGTAPPSGGHLDVPIQYTVSGTYDIWSGVTGRTGTAAGVVLLYGLNQDHRR